MVSKKSGGKKKVVKVGKLKIAKETVKDLSDEEAKKIKGGEVSDGPTACGGCGTNTCRTCLVINCKNPLAKY